MVTITAAGTVSKGKQYVDPVAPDTGCRGTYTRLRDGVLPGWVDATGTSV